VAVAGLTGSAIPHMGSDKIEQLLFMRFLEWRVRLLGLILLLAGCVPVQSSALQGSSMLLERRGSPLAMEGPDAIALPFGERYRYGVVLGSVMTADGGRGCSGDAWLQPWKAPVVDVIPIAAGRLRNMFRFPQLLPGPYVLGVRCMGFQPVHQRVEVRVGQIVRALVTMRRQPLRREREEQ
jgi:hypothetical protein